MPTYEYECSACGHRFEKFQSITAARVRTCPRCGKGRVRRLLGTGAALLFKGPGFYATDYKRAGKPDAAKKEPAAEAAPAAKKDGAAEPPGGAKAKEK